jgi:GDP-L-fucose synthase
MPIKAVDRIYLAGHRGLVGAAIMRRLREAGWDDVLVRTHRELDLTRQADVESWFSSRKIDCVIVAAAKVGGIHANDTYRAEFLYHNLMISANVINAAYRNGIRHLLFLGSSCIYPRGCPQPMTEDYLLTSALEPTNEPYAIAKIAGVKLCETYNHQYGTRYISLMPTNLYGIGDNFDPSTSHVIPAMIRKIDDAKRAGRNEVTLWGTGQPLREFLFADDLADACVHVLQAEPVHELMNVGSGEELSIDDLAHKVAAVVGYRGTLRFDPGMPDGTPRKLVDSTRIRALGWQPRTSLEAGLRRTYDWYRANLADEVA